MECYVCGKDIGGNIGMCSDCKAARTARREAPQSVLSQVQARGSEYAINEEAGFWLRFLACIIDTYVLKIAVALFSVVVSYLFWSGTGAGGVSVAGSGSAIVDMLNPSDDASTNMLLVGGLVGGAFGSLLVSILGYGPLFESSALMCTPGKWVLGLRVGDSNRQRLTFLRAFGRSAAKILSYMSFGLGFVCIGFTPRKQGLHDIVAGTTVFRRERCSPATIGLAIGVIIVLALIHGALFRSLESEHQPGIRNMGGYRVIKPGDKKRNKGFNAEEFTKSLNELEQAMKTQPTN